jgi:hypothetical protein
VPCPEPRFLRDTLDMSDVAGTKSRPLYPFKQRNTMGPDALDDIRRPPRVARGKPDSMDVRDIVGGEAFRSTRVTNALDPVYVINSDVIQGEAKMHPPHLPPASGSNYSLDTKTIDGATAGWKPSSHIPEHRRRNVRNANNTHDIDGATADSVPHSIVTSRRTNPLNPSYTALGGGHYAATPPATSSGLTAIGTGPAHPSGSTARVVKASTQLPHYASQTEEVAALRAEVAALRRTASAVAAAASSEQTARGGGAPAAPAFERPEDGSGFVVRHQLAGAPRSRPDTGSASARHSERLVLQSRDGRPRVDLAATERRQDIEDVHNLPV